MNFSLINVALFGAGALLIAGAIKDKSPRQIIQEAMEGVAPGGKKGVNTDEENRGRARDAAAAAAQANGTAITPMDPVAYATPYKVTSV